MLNLDKHTTCALLTVAAQSVSVAHVACLADAALWTTVCSAPDASALAVTAHYHIM